MKFLLLLGVLTISFLALSTADTYAATFVVDSVADGSDSSAGDGSCDTGTGTCTLRAAIEEANDLAGPDSVDFNISGAGVHTIAPTTDLPPALSTIVIDGLTQPGATCGTLVPVNKTGSNTPHNLLIEIDASQIAGSVLRLESQSQDSTIRGLVINSVQNNSPALDLTSTNYLTNTLIECNYIGTDTTGTSAPSNSGVGLLGDDSFRDSVIRNNLFSGNSFGAGLDMDSPFNTVSGNLIGTDVNGTSALGNPVGIIFRDFYSNVTNNIVSGNNGDGIYGVSSGANNIKDNYIGLGLDGNVLANDGNGVHTFSAWNEHIGGSAADEANIISGNQQNGILMENDCDTSNATYENEIMGNLIGTNIDGSYQPGYGNQGAGIRLSAFGSGPGCRGMFRNQIGGADLGEPNIIVGNAEQGIILHQEQDSSLFGTSMIGNVIYNNGGLSIDLATDNVINSSGDATADIGLNAINNFDISFPATRANSYINHPTVNSTTHTEDSIEVNYDFVANSIADAPPELQGGDLVGYRLDFYMSDSKDILGSGEGKTHIGSFIVDGSESDASHTFASPTALAANSEINVSATATVLWRNKGESNPCDNVSLYGVSPPYVVSSCGG